jgi:hypothetical protein
MYVNLYRAEPEPSMLELRGALDLLLRAQKDQINRDAYEKYDTHNRQHRTELYKSYKETSFILSKAEFAVRAQLKAMLGQNKEYTQGEALRSVK